jgi:hypothetical protein
MATQQLVDLQEGKFIKHFVVATLRERDFELDEAIYSAQTLASADANSGVLVTRHDFWRFSVILTAAVPYGWIEERDFA